MVLTNNSRFLFLVSTLPGYPDTSLLRAAARAGAVALLDVEGVVDVEAAVRALIRRKTGQTGLRLDGRQVRDLVPPELLESLDLLVFRPALAALEASTVRALARPGRAILVECTTRADAEVARDLPVDGLIAKGHEAGGRVGEETTFVLVQRLMADYDLPVWAQGGVGTHTVAACAVAGCAGAVLDVQLALARESTLPEAAKLAIASMAGDETVCLGASFDERYRVYRRPGLQAVDDLLRLEREVDREEAIGASTRAAWREAVASRLGWRAASPSLWPIGQDGAFAADLARRYRSVAGILEGLRACVDEHLEAAREHCPLDRHSPLARSHGTEYPILQGPMTRVSDTAAFAAAVAEGGALPFLALALLRAPQVRELLRETKERLADRPWGIGILGFVPVELRQEQLAVVEELRPSFAVIAGGRPDQAAHLERLGIATYLHLPAPTLLRMFLDAGARRFVFEGRECGGHVGPRTSFVLWQLAVDALLAAIDAGIPAEQLHVVFAGGIHDARSAAMVAAIAAPLAKAGARIGALMGTAYLFTQEAVRSAAIVEGFQEEALRCNDTVLVETGPGHSTRCVPTEFCNTFHRTRRALVAQGRTTDDVRVELETLNLGRLRIAAKGIKRADDAAAGQSRHTRADAEEQRLSGMYMIGQIAALRSKVSTIAALHAEVCAGSSALLRSTAPRVPAPHVATAAAVSTRVAIVGMGCLLPEAPDVPTLWRNVLNKVDAIREVPPERFDVDRYFDPDRHARDRIYSKWGGFLAERPFDPLKHGIPPAAVPSIDPFQLLTLEVVDQALRDAGYADRPFNRDRTSIILGASGGVGDLGFRYGLRAGLPMLMDPVPNDALAQLPEWTEDSFAGVLLNVAAGRVANRLDLGGLNFTVDAACASSLAAVFLASRELEAGTSDMVLVGGIDTVNSPFGYLCFSSAQALSPRGRCRTFDEKADGIVISEGLVVLVLKRVEDAERDGDRIYAVIRSVAGSSDGRGKGLTAPRPEGQVRVLERAYAAAGFSPATVGLVEAHGTGTVAGDGAEVTALTRVFASVGAQSQTCALGSIKSMIGHTKSAAGVSGLMKVALALHHKVLPPTLHVTMPNPRLRDANTPFYVNTEPRPWMAPPSDQRRRAGVSSFGFGGTNFHVVVEEHDPPSGGELPAAAVVDEWPAELLLWSAPSPAALSAALAALERVIVREAGVPLRAVAAAVCRSATAGAAGGSRLAIVAHDLADLARKIAAVRTALEAGQAELSQSTGIFLRTASAAERPIAFVFPGQGSQYPGMHRDLAMRFPDVRHSIELADEATAGQLPRPLSSYVFPPPAFTDADRRRQLEELTDTTVAQPALGAVEMGLHALLDRLGVRPQFTAGHSYGEYVALCVAGAFPPDTLIALSAARGRFIKEASGDSGGTMAAVAAPAEAIAATLGQNDEVYVANFNAPRQTVIAGSAAAIDRAVRTLAAAGLTARPLPVACAFHSPLVEGAQRQMAALLARTSVRPPRVPVFSNSLARPYGADAEDIRTILSEHIVRPVRFVDEVQAMYAAGARVFLEVGPKSVLGNMMRETLAGRDAIVLSLDAPDQQELRHLLITLAQLSVAGVPIDHTVLWQGRSIPRVRIEDLPTLAPAPPPAHAWFVSGGHARRLNGTPAAPKTPPARPVGVTTPPAEAPPARVAGKTTRLPPAAAVATTAPAAPAVPVLYATPSTPDTRTRLIKGGHMHDSLPLSDRAVDHHEIVMRQFQQLMSQFLQTQALVMTTYLQGAPQAMPASALLAASPLPLLPETLPTPVAMSPRPQVPTPATLVHPAGRNGDEPKVAADPPPARPVEVAPLKRPEADTHLSMTEAEVLKRLLQIASDRTGYPEDMLTVDANMEADLGIDSIKRMEILAAFQQVHATGKGGAFQDAMEKLTALKTLRESAAALAQLFDGQPAAAAS